MLKQAAGKVYLKDYNSWKLNIVIGFPGLLFLVVVLEIYIDIFSVK